MRYQRANPGIDDVIVPSNALNAKLLRLACETSTGRGVRFDEARSSAV
jgi:hypothetical protein